MIEGLEKIITLLDHEHIRKRKKGIRMAAELLKKEQYQEKLCALLKAISEKDMYVTVRDLAKQVLEEYCLEPSAPRYTEGEEHMVGGVCNHCGNPNYYDKRIECQEVERVRGLEGYIYSELVVTCEHCGEQFKLINVDCEGYR